jgi:hypothetical protein
MAIHEESFDNESELEQWVYANLESFLGQYVLLRKFLISTSAGKGAIPDGIAFSFASKQWFIIECELLRHGVWPHIAEQISRFVVALQNPDTLRRIRDELFEHVINSSTAQTVAAALSTSSERLLQQLELFIEGVQPSVVIFIDDANEDLEDFARALAVSTSVYRVRKFQVNGRLEYYSPDVKTPVLQTESDDRSVQSNLDYEVVELLGGGSVVPESVKERCKAFLLNDGRVVQIRRSKFHPKDRYYWYGISPSAFVRATEFGTTHFVFVMGTAGFTTVPIQTVRQFCDTTNSTKHAHGSISHYHVVISPEPEPVMYWSNEVPKYDLSEYWCPFD